MITLTKNQWEQIKTQLSQDWPLSYIAIRSVMKRELGFTVRINREFYGHAFDNGYKTTVYLDFYDDVKESWFTLKYLNRE